MKDKLLRKALGLSNMKDSKANIEPNSLLHNVLVAITRLNQAVFPAPPEVEDAQEVMKQEKSKKKEKK